MTGTFWEIFTLVTGIVYIILEILQSKWMWAVGFLTAVAAMVVFWMQGLYASFGLNCYYFVMAGVGMWQWIKDERKLGSAVGSGRGEAEKVVPSEPASLHLTRMTPTVALASAAVMIAGTAAFYFLLKALGDSQPLLDVSVTVLSAIATWWLAKSYKEQWLLWIVADAATMTMCLMQGLPWMTALYGAYTLSAAYGYIYWKRNGKYV